MTRHTLRLLSGVAAVVVLLLGVGGVATARSGAAAAAKSAGDREVDALSWNYTCFGYTGTFRDGSSVVYVDWITTGDECFGIAPDRTIWHAWPGSGGWQMMPGNGRADDTRDHFYENTSTGSRTAGVWVADGTGYWCQDYTPSGGWTGHWYDC
ncbi:hypothetical protein ACFXGA_32325 [Actinosynnema sp. NPDC059335]|uniref:hypothetical protein n=1 Tax=Actinosynnema sp. NPDC059335 TaxID=3346804 RepID=UPI00366AF517